MSDVILKKIPLGKATSYVSQYQPDLLFVIPRQLHRDGIGILSQALPFKGCDVWNAFEISWLNTKGKPIVALGEFIFPCESPLLVESKSFKLYLNSFNNTKFSSSAEVTALLQRDLSQVVQANVIVKLLSVSSFNGTHFSGQCLDDLDVTCDHYTIQSDYLTTTNHIVTETVYSDLLKSNCLVTGQPDWGSVRIEYTGKKIQHEGLLQYIVSFRNHNEFHEQCVERIFVDIMKQCSPKKLTVHARYTRRGGLDINPYRSTEVGGAPENLRLCRQ